MRSQRRLWLRPVPPTLSLATIVTADGEFCVVAGCNGKRWFTRQGCRTAVGNPGVVIHSGMVASGAKWIEVGE